MVNFVTPWGATAVLTTNTAPVMGKINRYNVSAGGYTVFLPALSSITQTEGPRTIIEKDRLDASPNLITVQRSGSDTFDDSTTSFTIGSSGAQETVEVVSIGGSRYWKRLSGGSSIAGGGATLSGTETLTNKTMPLGSNTISGTTAQFNTALTDNDFATLAGVETLSGKTLTAPKLANNGFIADNNGNEQILFHTTALAVNQIDVTNAATGAGPTIAAAGGDPNINMNINGQGTGRVFCSGDQVVTATLAQTITNKVYTPRVLSDTNVASWTINSALYDFAENNGLTANVTINNPTGVPTNYQPLITELTGTAARTITYGSQFVDGPGGTRPTTTTGTQRLTLAWRWTSTTSQWRLWAQGSA